MNMVNETASSTVIKLSPSAKFSGPNANQVSGKLPENGGQELPIQGKGQPRVVQGSTEIREAISEINEFVQTVQRDLSFNMDEASGHTVIKVIDRESGDLVRQIPSEEVLAIASHIRDVRETTMDANEVPPGLLFSDST
jgi:flagellar protein FlaG